MIDIRHIKYNEINFEKYNLCIENSDNSIIYAFSWYLDIVCKKDWEILVLDDYRAVLPIPFSRIKRQFLKRMVTQPLDCQQLGLFSKTNLKNSEFIFFLKKFLKFNIHSYHLNYFNVSYLKNYSFETRNNYELNIYKPYNELKKKYSKNLNRNLKKALKQNLKITNEIITSDFILMKKNEKKYKISKKQYGIMTKLINTILSKNLGKFYGVLNNDEIIAIAFFIETKQRLIHLFSVNTNLGKQTGASSFLFDYIIFDRANTKPIILDFEGSMIHGIAKFYKNFGAINKPYAVISKKSLR